MKKLVVLIFIGIFSFGFGTEESAAQDVLNGIYVKYRDKQRKPIPYKPLREADVTWGKFIVRTIDLREKMNLPLYYPTEPILERQSLIDLLLKGIVEHGLTAYEARPWSGTEFEVPLAFSEIEEVFDAQDDTVQSTDLETGEYIEKIIPGEFKTYEVMQYLVREMWYFDRKYSQLNVRIIAICPIREYTDQAEGNLSAASAALALEAADEVKKRQAFWIEFGEVRPLLANHEVYNPNNDAERRTFDDIFFKRRFSSYIVQESNVYNNRNVNEYSLGQKTLQEAERVKNKVFDYEQDLWEY